MRKCVICKIEKPTTSEFFYKDKNRPLGLMYRCKSCDKEKNKREDRTGRYAKMTIEQKDAKKETCRKYSKTIKGKAIALLNAYKKIDLKKSRICDLTQQDIIDVLNKNCVYCGYSATGFDRINNEIGHTKTNCIPACKECNVARMDNFSHEETFTIGKAIKEIKDKRLYPNI